MGRLTVALTGGSGFLGRHLLASLAQADYHVRALSRAGRLADSGPEAVIGTLEDPAALAVLTRGADAIIHAAGLIKSRGGNEFQAVNKEGTARLLRCAAAHAPGAHVVLVSSLAAREPHLSPYAASKRGAEDVARELIAPERLTILRLPALYGPFDRETLTIFKAARLPLVPLTTSGRERIALMHVEDAATAIARLARAGNGGTYSLADRRPHGYAMREILAEAARAQGRNARFVRVSPLVLKAVGIGASVAGRLAGKPAMLSPGKVREMLHDDWSVRPEDMPTGLSARVRDIALGFRETVAWYRSAGWL